MNDNTLTIGHLRKLIADLPDDTQITECDHDESHLHCEKGQFILDAQFLMFIPGDCYGNDEDDLEEWIEDVRVANINPLAPR
jgi:hypothetical protein